MERVRRLYALWGWLPAFRVVAETEHLPTASEQLGITPQALSRSIKLLEEQLGKALFRKAGRGIKLTEDGRALLGSVRDAMRGIDDGIVTLLGDEMRGPITVGALAHHAWIFVTPAITMLHEEHPGLIPAVESVSGEAARDGLNRGVLDVAIGDDFSESEAVLVQPLAELSYGVYCGKGHALFRRREVRASELAEHAFVVPGGPIGDGWPPDTPRRVGARVESFQLALDLVASGQYLAFLPDVVPHVEHWERPLHRLPVERGHSRTVYVATRRAIGEHRRVEAAVAALRETARRLSQRRR